LYSYRQRRLKSIKLVATINRYNMAINLCTGSRLTIAISINSPGVFFSRPY